jgi:hypothetical protein
MVGHFALAGMFAGDPPSSVPWILTLEFSSLVIEHGTIEASLLKEPKGDW